MTSPAIPGDLLRARAAEQPDRVIFIHAADDASAAREVTYGELYQRASIVAARLTALGLWQRPVLLVYRPGPAFAEAFFGTLLAGAIAVPVPVPQFAAQCERLERVAIDCTPGAVLTTSALAASLVARFDVRAHVSACPWVETDTLQTAPDRGEMPYPPFVPRDSVALLQYTSGSTAEPRGVMVTHDNLAHNATTIIQDLPVPDGPGVSWLPHFHDMGLIAGIVTPIYRDQASVQMSPMAFLQRPLRWLETITRYGAHTSGAPNFAYALCVRAAATAAGSGDSSALSGLDLRSWTVAYVGAEPVRPSTLAAFAECFAPYGFRAEALTPCYGMAEATLLVTSKRKYAAPTLCKLSRAELEAGRAMRSNDASALQLAGCGYPVTSTDLRIVDPDKRVELPRGRVGEVWVAGPQIARGYWRSTGDDAFKGRLAANGAGPFLRTGDLGFLSDDGELVFVDRLKDLMIVNGQNYMCHDLEHTAGSSHPLLSPESCVACGLDGGEQTRIAVIAELPADEVARAGEAAQAIRSALFTRHGLPAHTVVFVPPRRLSRTTSGKLQRRVNASRMVAGDLRILAQYGDPLPSDALTPVTPTTP